MENYKILGLEIGASKDDIKRAFRSLAAQHHPDRGGDEEEYRKVIAAYTALMRGEVFVVRNTFDEQLQRIKRQQELKERREAYFKP